MSRREPQPSCIGHLSAGNAAEEPPSPAQPRVDGRRNRPWMTLAWAVAVRSRPRVCPLVRQELFLVLWLLFLALFANLALGFVRAVERLAGAAERLATAG